MRRAGSRRKAYDPSTNTFIETTRAFTLSASEDLRRFRVTKDHIPIATSLDSSHPSSAQEPLLSGPSNDISDAAYEYEYGYEGDRSVEDPIDSDDEVPHCAK